MVLLLGLMLAVGAPLAERDVPGVVPQLAFEELAVPYMDCPC